MKKLQNIAAGLSFLLLAALIMPGPARAQNPAPADILVVAGSITNIHGKGMNDATVRIFINQEEINVIHTGKEGRFYEQTALPQGVKDGDSTLTMRVERAGYINQTVPVDKILDYGYDKNGSRIYASQTNIIMDNDINAAFWIATGVLILIYILIAAELLHRTLAAFLGGALLLAISYTIGSFNPDYFIVSFEAAMSAIDLNVVFLLMAMMMIVGVTKKTGLFQWMAYKAFHIARGNIFILAAVLMFITAFVSAFLDNVTTMLLIIPVTLEISRTLKLNPIALLMPEVFASNVGGTATLIGDPPNILIGSYAHLSFMDFAQNLTLVCVICLAATILYMLWLFRKDLRAAKVEDIGRTVAALRQEYRITNSKLLAQCLLLLALTVFLFMIHGLLHMEPSVAALLGASLLLVISRVDIVEILEKEIEWPTLVFFIFLFVVIGAAEDTGLIQVVAEWVRDMSQGDLILAMMLILWVSGVASALIDNIPFTATMLPVVAFLTESIPGAGGGILWWCLALGACLGGNATMIGASANVVTVGMADKAGYSITFMKYMKVAALPTAITLIISSLWLLYVDLPHTLGN
ncbi:MAG: ArsB/NhaD family transporter [Desulfarculales bacterium]|jgi:Na+/H+ antiporter NhaD/arsenite permease-like protein|nr:ArsB/NhaD family transporter [Desulfarculales bacterium]